MTAPALSPPVISVRNLSKSFPGVQALQEVSFDLLAGEVHGLVGANGAGKSTLIRILSGADTADAGTILAAGAPLAHGGGAGIATIYQELTIVAQMSAMSNVFLGAPLMAGPFVARRRMRRRFADLATRTGAGFSPDVKAGSLSVANQQLIEIMRAIEAEHAVLIMDEPTAPLGPAERGKLYELIGRLKTAGTAVIFISHDLDEVLRLCDRVSVMREGRLIASQPVAGWTKPALVGAMLGDIQPPPPRQHRRSEAVEILRVEDMAAAAQVSGISFALRQGEILGIAGLVGSGRTEILRALAGADPQAAGRLWFAGAEQALPHSIRAALRLGIALAPEDRKAQGLVLGRDGTSNITLAGLAAVSAGPFLSRGRRARAARSVAQRVGFSVGRLGAAAGTLSGGNQQKLVLGKWLHRQPRVLLLDEPTRGIDIGAKQEIFATIRSLTEQAMAVVLVSSDLEEVVEHADTVLVLARGRQIGLLDHGQASVARILNLIFAVEEQSP